MPKVTFNPIISDMRNRMGNMVFSKWKGVNYVRVYTGTPDAKTEAQQKTRNAFSGLVNIWKNLDSVIRESWNHHARGKNLTGYNAFIGENFKHMKADLEILISKEMGEEKLKGFTAVPGQNTGEIDCAYASALPEGKRVTVFTMEARAGVTGVPVTRHEVETLNTAFTLSGLEAEKKYHVHAVVTDGPIDGTATVSEAASAEAMTGGAR